MRRSKNKNRTNQGISKNTGKQTTTEREKTVLSSSEILEKLPTEVLENMPDEVRTYLLESASFHGPLPPPSMFSEYERVLSGSSDRIVTMAEKEQNHRIDWENRGLKASVQDTFRGQWFAFFIAIIAIGGAIYLGKINQPWVAAVLIGVPLTGLVSSFLKKK